MSAGGNRHDGKSYFKIRGWAMSYARRHRRDYPDCAKCATGKYRYDWYDCTEGGVKHHHTGHRWLWFREGAAG